MVFTAGRHLNLRGIVVFHTHTKSEKHDSCEKNNKKRFVEWVYPSLRFLIQSGVEMSWMSVLVRSNTNYTKNDATAVGG